MSLQQIHGAPAIRAVALAAVFALLALPAATALGVQYVIAISVDGMGSNYVTPLLTPGANELTTFKRFQTEGAGTLNARDDYNYAITLPNHVTMMTSRGVSGTAGHGWSGNGDPGTATLASNKGTYVASAFDVAHDNGKSTGIWAGKSKFSLFQQSYSAAAGALDVTGPDNGRDKIDTNYVVDGVSAAMLTTNFINQMTSNPVNFAFLHYQDPDAAGHGSGWSVIPRTTNYANALKAVDTQIGNILAMIQGSPTLNGNTTVIVTADHGGHGTTHGDTSDPLDYTIPFYVWGAGVAAGADLYALNPSSRTNPVGANPPYTGGQPVRNGDMGNLSLDLLDLPSITGLPAIGNSTINFQQDLVVPEPSTFVLAAAGLVGLLVCVWRKRRRA